MNTDTTTDTTTEEEDVSPPRRGRGRPEGTTHGHTETLVVKLHPDLKDYLKVRSDEESYASVPDYLRRLIVADMRAHS